MFLNVIEVTSLNVTSLAVINITINYTFNATKILVSAKTMAVIPSYNY